MADDRKERGLNGKRKKAAREGRRVSRFESGCREEAVMAAYGLLPHGVRPAPLNLGPVGSGNTALRFLAAQPSTPTGFSAEV